MLKYLFFLAIIILFAATSFAADISQNSTTKPSQSYSIVKRITKHKQGASIFKIVSETVKNRKPLPNAHVFNGFGCSGENLTPSFKLLNIPKDAKSLAFTVYDPDAPTGSGWWHLVAINIPANTTEISKESLVNSLQIKNDYGNPQFDGACPPKGDKKHRYIFTAYALKIPKIEVPTSASAAMAGYFIKANTIASAKVTAHYKR